jgi:tetratricopeptide (TPR) repeat protein
LSLAALLYGAGIVENWAFVGFFPVFVTAIIWLRGREFFRLQFVTRMIFCGLLGLLMFFFLPIVAKLTSPLSFTFWDALRPALLTDWMALRFVANGEVRYAMGILSLATLLPILLMSIRWSSNFGDTSKTGKAFLKYFFYLVYLVIFTTCVWLMFDPKFSPRQVFPTLGLPAPALTLYYLTALSIGYFSGYFLLVFSKNAPSTRRERRPETALPEALMWLAPVIVTGTIAFTALGIGLLAYKNVPIVRTINDDTLLKYAQFTAKNLPPNGAILLADGDQLNSFAPAQSIRPFLIQAELTREGRTKKYPVVDTQQLNWVPYFQFLHQRYPDYWPEFFKTNDSRPVSPLSILGILNVLSKSNNICYLNPSFGYYFEEFYQEPRGMVYTMKTLPADTLLPPPLDKKLVAENNDFWSNVTESVSTPIINALSGPDPDRHINAADWLLLHLHIVPESNQNAIYIGTVYSRDLDYWGVQLQRRGELDLAATNFAAALNLNPNNISAGINLDFNGKLRSKTVVKVDPNRVNPDQFGKSSNWSQLLNANGPLDEPSFLFYDAMLLANANHFFRQATEPFTRIRNLDPDNLETRLQLAQIFIFNRLTDRAIEALHDPLTEPNRFGLTDNNSVGLNILASAAYFQKNDNARAGELLELEMKRHPDDESLRTAGVQAYMLHALYPEALRIINHQLQKTPDDPKWLFGKGYAELQSSNYVQAATTLSRVLTIQTNDPTARFNRALAYLAAKNLDGARGDYLELQNTYTNSYQVAFGLGEIAWQQQQTNEAIRNYQIYLANARTNTAEATNVLTRLRELQK